MTSATALAWFARHELRLAWREWLAMMTGGRRTANARRRHRPPRLRGVPASAGLGRGRPLCRPAGAARPAVADHHDRDDIPRLGADHVAGHRIGHPGVLRPRRPRSHHVVADATAPRYSRSGSARSRCRSRRWRCCSRRPLSMSWSLTGGARGLPLSASSSPRPVGRGDRDRDHDHAVSPDRPGADAADRADSRGHHRRRLRDRAADRRDPVLRHAVTVRDPDLRCRDRARARSDSILWWPARAASAIPRGCCRCCRQACCCSAA